MKLKPVAVFLALIAATLALPALGDQAQSESSSFTYFDRPGASLVMHDQDMMGCVAIAYPLVPPNSATAGGVVAAALGGWLDEIHYNAFFGHNLERCMLARGWSVVRVPDAEAAAILKMDPAAIGERLRSWIGQAAPHGEVIRRFDGPGELGLGQGINAARSISAASLYKATMPPVDDFKQETSTFTAQRTLNRSQQKPLSQDQLKQPDPAMAIVVVELRGAKENGYGGFGFKRMAASLSEFVHENPGVEAEWFATPAPKDAFRRTEGKGSVTAAFAVHPGLWAIAGGIQGFGEHCLMAPSIQVNAGDVLFLGSFDLDDRWSPGMNLDPARAALSANPSLAEKVRAAPWVNGLSWTCRTLIVNAYAIKGAPYQSDYPWRPL